MRNWGSHTMKVEDLGLRENLTQQLESLRLAGITHLPRAVTPPTDVRVDTASNAIQKSAGEESEKKELLTVIAKEVAACTLCNERASSRNKTVFRVGHLEARLRF